MAESISSAAHAPLDHANRPSITAHVPESPRRRAAWRRRARENSQPRPQCRQHRLDDPAPENATQSVKRSHFNVGRQESSFSIQRQFSPGEKDGSQTQPGTDDREFCIRANRPGLQVKRRQPDHPLFCNKTNQPQQLRYNEDTAVEEIASGNDDLQRLWPIPKGEKRFAAN
ncbi:hypothetical protein COL922a_001965 [Colletotrichum nupharicola]|nr:hypothetical protein COL922a_001965 [Colletotrichum nupharicola]